ncbi:MAG: hypothetical protein JSR39_00335 [Verrucomicrobia bacterium]|nr:hypothetical protein [Verrucomicrobiota bacterium]
MSSEKVSKVAAGFFPELAPFTFQNEPLITYMLSVIKYNGHFANIYIGLPNGGFIGVIGGQFADKRTYLTDPTKPWPEEAKFVLQFVDRVANPPTDTWYYLTEDFKQIDQEVLYNSTYDSRTRPWFIGAVKTHSLYWTEFYPFQPQIGIGISVGNPIYGQQTSTVGNSDPLLAKPDMNQSISPREDLLGVIGIDLTMVFLDDFIKSQDVSEHGKVFITNDVGKIIVPTRAEDMASSPIDSALVSMLFQQYSNDPLKPDNVARYQGVEYLSYTSKLPGVFGRNWYIMTIAPSDDFFAGMIKVQHRVLLFIFGILFLAALVVIYFAKKVSFPIKRLASEVDKIRKLELLSEARIPSNINEIQQIDKAIASMRRVIRSFCRYLPKEIVKDLIDNHEEITLGGKKKEITIFVSDITNFTSIAEALPMDQLTALLGEYFDVMSKIILKSHGTIDKFIGDGIMAFWGAPIEFEDHAQRACIAALQCLAIITALNEKRRASGAPEFYTRFGINTGTVIVGNIGTEERMNYTAIGNAVNTTHRLQEEGKRYHTSIIISEKVYQNLGSNFVVRPLDAVVVKEKKEKSLIYELAGVEEGEKEIQADLEKRELCRAFTAAFEAVQADDLERAYAIFSEIAAKHPDDYPTQIHLKRIEERRGR